MAACSNCCCRFLLLEGKGRGFHKETSPGYASTLWDKHTHKTEGKGRRRGMHTHTWNNRRGRWCDSGAWREPHAVHALSSIPGSWPSWAASAHGTWASACLTICLLLLFLLLSLILPLSALWNLFFSLDVSFDNSSDSTYSSCWCRAWHTSCAKNASQVSYSNPNPIPNPKILDAFWWVGIPH